MVTTSDPTDVERPDDERRRGGASTSPLERLSADQQERLAEILDNYLIALEGGERLSLQKLTAAHPDLAAPLSRYLHRLHALCGADHVADELLHDAVGADQIKEIGSGALRGLQASGVGWQARGVAPNQIGDYRLIAAIGQGGMGIVYEAVQLSMHRRVALKLLPLMASLNRAQVTRFQNEAKTAGVLEHPHIVPVYNVGVEQGVHFYAMKFIDGLSLDQWIERNTQSGAQREPWQRIVSWIIDIADALHAAHCAGIVHRDVKPSNLILDTGGKIWIADFGLARSDANVSLTGSGEMLGTIRYMSPEQASGKSALVDGRSDQYSLATTLFELLTLRPAFAATTAAEVLRQMDAAEVVPLHRWAPDLPRDLATVVAKAMSRDRDARYETTLHFAEELQRVLDQRPTLARPPKILDVMLRYAARHRGIATLGVSFTALTVVGMTIATLLFASLRHAAILSATRAERQERLARNAVDQLGAETAEMLSTLPGTALVRERLLSETLDYYMQFISTARQTPSLRFDVATTYGKIGSLQLELGRSELALINLRQSETLFAKLAEEAASDAVMAGWAVAQNNLGEALDRLGYTEEAARYYSRAIENGKLALLVTKQPSIEQQLATTYNNLGLLLAEVDAKDQAEEAFQSGLALLFKPSPAREPAQKSVGRVDGALASVDDAIIAAVLQRVTIQRNLAQLLIEDAPSRAIELAQQALDTQLAIAKDRPNDVRLSSEIASTLNRLGSAYAAHGDQSAAVDTLQRARQLEEQLAERYPGELKYLELQLVTCNSLGLTYTRVGDWDRAAETFDAAITVGEQMREITPVRAATLSLCASVINNAALLAQRRGLLDMAVQRCREAIDLQTQALELTPQRRSFQRLLQQHQNNLHDLIRGSQNGISGI